MRTVRISVVGLVATVLLLAAGSGSATAAPPWSQELTVTSDAALNSHPHGLAVTSNARGDAAVLWWETRPRPSGSGSGPALLAMTRSAHGPWSAPRTLLVTGAFQPGFLDTAISPTGEISAVLTTQLEPTDPSVSYEIRGRADGTWAPPSPMLAQGRPIYGPVIARDVHSGRDVAAWFEGTGTSRSVLVASRTSGGPWSAPTVVATGRTGATIDRYLSAAVRGTRSVVAWSVDRGTSGNGPHDVAAAIDSGNGTWPVETVATSLSVLTRVAALIPTDDTATVAWVSRYPVTTDDTLYVSRRGASDWSDAQIVKRGLYGSSVALLAPATGGVVAGYQSSATRAVVSELRPDGTWSELVLSAPVTTGGVGSVSLASDEQGNLAAGWPERYGTIGAGARYANQIRTRPAGTDTWTPATTVSGPSPESIGRYYAPLVAMTSDGPLAAW